MEKKNIAILAWGLLLSLLLVNTSVALSAEASNESSEVTDVNSAETLPVILQEPTTAAPKADADGSSVNTLQYVAVIVRHGERFKDKEEFFENDPFVQEDPFWMPSGFGQLRNRGKFRMYTIGQGLRQRYNGFISPEYYYSHVKFYSPDMDRCLMSAQLVSLGLFPPTGINIWNDNVGKFYQPIPIKSFDPNQDNIFNDSRACPPYERELTKILNHELKEINTRYQNIYEYVAFHTGKNISNLQHINDVYQVLRIENENGRDMPEWTKAVFPSKLKALAGLYNQMVYQNDKMKRIKAGPIFSQILKDLASKSTHLMDKNLKMRIWTGFDATILKMIHTLRFTSNFGITNAEEVMKETVDSVFQARPPPTDADGILETSYGSSLMIELHFIDRKYYVKVLYADGGLYKPPIVFKLRECNNSSLIPYDTFAATYKKFMITDAEWNKKCGIATC